MLLKKEHIDSAMSLTCNGINIALKNAGYYDKVKTADFRGMSIGGNFVYDCTFYDEDTSEDEDCIVYVSFNDKGVMLADY